MIFFQEPDIWGHKFSIFQRTFLKFLQMEVPISAEYWIRWPTSYDVDVVDDVDDVDDDEDDDDNDDDDDDDQYPVG